MKNSCKSCLYCIPLQNAASILVCANRHDLPGRLTLIDTSDYCANHKKTKTVNRPDVTQPGSCDIKFIPLTQGKVAVVDAEDYDWLSQYKWYANKKAAGFYAATHKGAGLLYMHREIMKYKLSATRPTLSANLVVDHIDRNPLNNRRSNLRLCTQGQNLFNQRPRGGSSKYKGVSWNKKQKQWSAQIEKNSKQFHLGYFKNEKHAARAYDKMARKLFGDFAYLNFNEK